MVQVRFRKINSSELSSLDIIEGQIIFVQDTQKLYLDKDNTHRIQIDGINYTGSNGITITNKNITNAGVRAIETGTTNGTIKVNTNGTDAEISVYGLGDLAFKSVVDTSDITTGVLPVSRGGTGIGTFTSGEVLIGSGTSAIATKGIDISVGGTAASTKLITSGAVNAGLANKLDTSLKGSNNGLAELDANGKVPSLQLPSYVDDVIEGYYYNNKFYKEAAHTTEIAGETGKIYVDITTEKTYRWGGNLSGFVVISETLALGETSSTAYRGDRGKTAYDHATDSNRLTTAQSEGLYKLATTAEGHVKSISAVGKSDITALGIPGQDTTYESKSAASGGTDVSLVTTGEKYTWNNKIDNSALTNYVQNTDYASSSNAGVIKTGGGLQVNINGVPSAEIRNYASYEQSGAALFISKGTLENVITGKELLVPNDITVTPVQQTGATVGTIQVGNGSAITLYAPQPGNVSTELVSANQTYYLTGVQETTAASGSQIYNTRLSNTFTGLKYQTSTSAEGGSLYVDDREVVLGLHYEIS